MTTKGTSVGQIELKVRKYLTKSKPVQLLAAREPIVKAIVLALPSFLEQNSWWLEGNFTLEKVYELQVEALKHAVQFGEFEQMMATFEAPEVVKLDQTYWSLSASIRHKRETILALIEKTIVPLRQSGLAYIRCISFKKQVEFFSKFASSWATQQFSEHHLTMWQVVAREPFLLVCKW